MSTERVERTYRLEPLDTTGVFLGLGVVQCGILGAGVTLAVVAVTAGIPLALAALPVVAALVASFARAGGLVAWQWLPLAAGWLRHRRNRRWHARLPLWSSTADEGTKAPMPPCLEGLDIVGVDWRPDVSLGAIRDRRRSTLTSVVPVTGPQFIVESRAEQERLLAGWGELFAQFAVERGVVTHLAWSDLTRPSGMQQHVEWVDGEDRGERNAAAVESYRALLDVANATAVAHDVVVTVTVARDRLRGRRADADTDERLARALVSSTEALLRSLRSARLTGAKPLDPAGLQRMLRTRIDPITAHAVPTRSGRLGDRLALVRTPAAGPLAVEAGWNHIRVDGAFHRTWWIGSWPRLAVPPAWLEPFLSGSAITRTMTVVLVPISTHQSRRRIERDLVKLESDATTKQDNGRRIDARHRRTTQALLDREEELVAGYAEMAYAGLVTVTARTLDDLERHGEIIEQLARESGMDLRVLHARQDIAWAAALPLGLAPSTLLAS